MRTPNEICNHRSLLIDESANENLKQAIAARRQVQKALRRYAERFSKAFKSNPIPLAIQSLAREEFVDANLGFQELTGYSREELLGHTPVELQLWTEAHDHSEILQKLRAQMSIRNQPCHLRTHSGQLRDTLMSVEVFELDGETFILTVAQDITEQFKLETQLHQSQKMDAVGLLAAGVAHDFNNLLTVILGHTELLLNGMSPAAPDYSSLHAIVAAVERATKLVRQLLTFSRKQYLQVRPMQIQKTLTALSELLPQVLGEEIKVRVIAAPGLPPINADAVMMEQMLMNLAVNARDAMPEGGELIIRADCVELGTEAAGSNPEARPGRFLRLSVTDTGCGISNDLLPRIFEPFYTTPIGG